MNFEGRPCPSVIGLFILSSDHYFYNVFLRVDHDKCDRVVRPELWALLLQCVLEGRPCQSVRGLFVLSSGHQFYNVFLKVGHIKVWEGCSSWARIITFTMCFWWSTMPKCDRVVRLELWTSILQCVFKGWPYQSVIGLFVLSSEHHVYNMFLKVDHAKVW